MKKKLLLTSLFIFMLCASTYAMTENIRQKMELQNACDAAAYSGAVVQADMLSRIAVLNRALSWTYLHTNRRQMDRLVGRWANRVSIQHGNDERLAWSLHCKCEHHLIQGTHERASFTVTPVYDILMRNIVDTDYEPYKDSLLLNKIVDFLVENATITEVPELAE